MKLHVVERIKLMQILPFPEKGHRMVYKIIDDLRKELSFSEQEHKDFKIIENKETGDISWEDSVEKEIEIGEIATGIICESLIRLDKEGKFDVYFYQLSIKFKLDEYLQDKNIK